MKYIIGTKVGMTQLFDGNGVVQAVTRVKVGPCQVTQVKTLAKDGYNAVQVGFGAKKKIGKALLGHLKNLPSFRYLKEFRLPDNETSERGQLITTECFNVNDKVKVSGITKAKGFQGVVKRHDFAGAPATHGHKDQLRMPGSIGAGGVQKVFKGMRMAGRMGGENFTINNLPILKIDLDANELFIAGALPGARGQVIYIEADGQMPAIAKDHKTAKAEVVSTENKIEPIDPNQSGENSSVELIKATELADQVKETTTN